MILVDHQIREAVAQRELTITEFEPHGLQPASYDLRIGNRVYAPPNPDHPYDLSANGGAYRLPPYGNVVLETYEDLKLPINMLGRIGLKSGFARRGLIASTGPQIDPGFEGKLFISLFNVTASAHVLKHKDTFLTIEFHALDTRPESPYQGPYQGMRSLGPEVLEAMVAIEGLTLSQMQKQFTELAEHVEAWSGLAGRVDEFLTEMKKHTAAFAALTARFGEHEALEARTGELRAIDLDQAKTEILQLFGERRRLFYSDIAEALHLEIGLIIEACEALQGEGLIEGERNGETRAQESRDEDS